MRFDELSWAGSTLEHLQLAYDSAVLTIWNESVQRRFRVCCSGFVGVADLCLWDDVVIADGAVRTITEADNEFLRRFFTAYRVDFHREEQCLKDGLLELRMVLTNDIPLRLYCQQIDVRPSHNQQHPLKELA